MLWDTVGQPMSSTLQSPGDGYPLRAVFLSYAREDTSAAQRLADALRSQGVEVWFDQSELRGGDVWDQKIRRQIKECALFLPVISERTQSRGEGYFRLEWKLAVERTHLMAEGMPFLAPIVVDATSEGSAIVPAEFMRVQWIRLPGALPTPQFVEQIRRMLESPRQVPAPSPRMSTGAVPRAPRKRAWLIGGIAALIAVAAAGFAVWRRSAAPAAPAPAPVPQAAASPVAPADVVDSKSVAVLPFENMSEDKDNAFFTDGVHEDVLTNLSYIHDLHVVSRTSVMQYRGTTKPIKQIGRELGVAYVLEGSVRREGNKVRVTGQLIDARTDEHVWAKAYDRDLNDIFAIQAELAQSIAEALQSVLSPETKVLLARRPTENTEAYDDYVKARQLRSASFLGAQKPAIEFLEAAVRLDPGFAAAWAELASRRAFIYFGSDKASEGLRLATEAIDTAVRLAPDDPAVIEARGDYYYYGYRDYARATEQYMRLAQVRQNDPDVYYSLGLIQRREGRFADALPNLRIAIKLDPTNHEFAGSVGETLVACRRYDEALVYLRRFAAAHPEDLECALGICNTCFLKDGSTEEMKAFAKRTVDDSQLGTFNYGLKQLAMVSGDWAEFIRCDRERRYYDGNSQDSHWNQDVNAAECFAEAGDMPAARARAGEALAQMKDVVTRQPGNADVWVGLCMAHALLGDKEEALRSAQKVAELMPESRDAVIGPSNSVECAVAFSWIGENDRALAEFERLIKVPYGTSIYPARVSCRLLRDDPRYQALVMNPKNNEPLF
jgi:TolB-like protein/cytochrome c-type biogenesis protein CcmH/NrfG